MTVSNQPYYTGNTYPLWELPLAKDSGAEDLTNVLIPTFTLTFRNSLGVNTLGTGAFSLKTANPAVVYYKPTPADVASPFTGFLIVKAFFPPSNSNLDEVVYDPIGGDPTNKSAPFVITAS